MTLQFLFFVGWLSAGGAGEVERQVLPAEFRSNIVYVMPETPTGARIEFYTDTGGGFNAIRRSLADRLQLPPIESGSGAELVSFPKFNDENSIPAPLWTESLRGGLAVVDDAMLKSDGFLGGKWFADRVWEFDYPAQRLSLLDGWSPDPGAAHVLALGFQTDDDGARTMHFPRMRIEVDGIPLQVLLDTGARFELGRDAAKAFGLPEGSLVAGSFIVESTFNDWREAHPDWTVIEQGDRVRNDTFPMIRVPEVTIAGHTVGPVWFSMRPDAAFKDYMSSMMDAAIVGAVGGSAFRYFRMVVDYPNARARFDLER